MTTTNNNEIQGSIVNIAHVVDGTKRVLALTTWDDLNFEVNEEEETAQVTTDRRTKRIRGSNAPVLEVSSLIAVDLDALEEMGLVDSDGAFLSSTSSRELDGAIHLEYYSEEDGTEDEKTDRFEEVESVNLSINPSETPPVASWTFWIHGKVKLDANSDMLVVKSGETYTIESDTEETYASTNIEDGGTLTQESGSTLNTTGY